MKSSAKIRHHLWKRVWKNQTLSMEKILQKSDHLWKNSAKNIIYGKDPAKIRHHIWKIFYKNKKNIYRKNSVQRNTIYGKDYAKIRHHLWKKFCIKKHQPHSESKLMLNEFVYRKKDRSKAYKKKGTRIKNILSPFSWFSGLGLSKHTPAEWPISIYDSQLLHYLETYS